MTAIACLAGVACDGDARLEQLALVKLVLHGYSYRDRLQTLEARRWLEMRALLATVQSGVAFRAIAVPVDVVR